VRKWQGGEANLGMGCKILQGRRLRARVRSIVGLKAGSTAGADCHLKLQAQGVSRRPSGGSMSAMA
jgi:hypothetical protein